MKIRLPLGLKFRVIGAVVRVLKATVEEAFEEAIEAMDEDSDGGRSITPAEWEALLDEALAAGRNAALTEIRSVITKIPRGRDIRKKG